MHNEKLFKPIVVEPEAPQLLEGVSIKEVKEILTSNDLQRSLALYVLMLQRDPHLSGAVSSRKEELSRLSYTIEGDKKIVSYLQAYLQSYLDLDELIASLYSALEYGFAVVDLVYDIRRTKGKDLLVPTGWRDIDAQRFGFDNARAGKPMRDALYLGGKKKKRYLSSYDERKVLLHLHKESPQTHLCRYSALYRAAWFVALKHQAIAANMQYFDTLGVPPLIIQHNGQGKEEIEAVLYQALSLRSNAVGVFPENTAVKLLTEGAGSKADFLSFVHYIDKEVSFLITSQVLATDTQGTGSYAQAKVHENRLDAKRDSDAKKIARTITTLLRHIASINFAQDPDIVFRFVSPQEIDAKTQSEVIKNLTGAGYEIPVSHIEKTFRIEGVSLKNKGVAQNAQTPLDLYDPPPRKVERNAALATKAFDKIENAATEAAHDQMLYNALVKRFYNALKEAESYEEAYTMLLQDSTIDEAMLERVLSEMIAKAHLAGLDDGAL